MRRLFGCFLIIFVAGLTFLASGCESRFSAETPPASSSGVHRIGQDEKALILDDSSPYSPPSSIYVADTTDNTIYVLPANASGPSVTPSAVISGSLTGLGNPVGVAVDSKGLIYVTNQIQFGEYTIETFPAGSNGNVVPIRTINVLAAHPFPAQEAPYGLTVRGSLIYVSVDDDVYFYWIQELGNDRTINFLCNNPNGCSGLTTGTNVALDSVGRIYTTDNSRLVVVYSTVASGDPQELGTLDAGDGSQPNAVAVDNAGHVYAGTLDDVAVFHPFGGSNTPFTYIPDKGNYVAARSIGAVYVSNTRFTNSIDVWQLSGSTWTMLRQVTGIAAPLPWHTGQIALH